jgi:hypothetical protein
MAKGYLLRSRVQQQADLHPLRIPKDGHEAKAD